MALLLTPTFANEAEKRQFWESQDSGDYLDWSQAQRVTLLNFEMVHEAH